MSDLYRESVGAERVRAVFVAFAGLVVTSCAALGGRAVTEDLHARYYAGDLAGAEGVLDRALAAGDGKESTENPEYQMDRGIVRQRRADFAGAIEDFKNAEARLEVLDFTGDTAEILGDYALNANLARYRGQPHEKILLTTLNVLNFLQVGDSSRVKVAARRAAVMDDYQTELEERFSFKNVLTPLLFGLAFEISGETNQSHVAYKTVFEKSGAEFLKPRLLHIARKHGFSDAGRWEREFGDLVAPVPDGHGTVLVVVMNGQSPIRVQQRFPVPEHMLYRKRDGISMADIGKTTVAVAALRSRSHRLHAGSASVGGGERVDLVQAVDIETQAKERFEKDLPYLISASVTRLLIRYAADQLAREEIGGSWGEFISVVTDVAGFLDVPDLRCWSLLPAEIMVSLHSAAAGPQEVHLAMSGAGNREFRRMVTVQPGGLSVAMFFVTE